MTWGFVHFIASGGRQPKPVKLKKMNKIKDHEIVSCACGPHTSALISRDGKLFMFGLPEDDLVDKSTGEREREREMNDELFNYW